VARPGRIGSMPRPYKAGSPARRSVPWPTGGATRPWRSGAGVGFRSLRSAACSTRCRPSALRMTGKPGRPGRTVGPARPSLSLSRRGGEVLRRAAELLGGHDHVGPLNAVQAGRHVSVTQSRLVCPALRISATSSVTLAPIESGRVTSSPGAWMRWVVYLSGVGSVRTWRRWCLRSTIT